MRCRLTACMHCVDAGAVLVCLRSWRIRQHHRPNRLSPQHTRKRMHSTPCTLTATCEPHAARAPPIRQAVAATLARMPPCGGGDADPDAAAAREQSPARPEGRDCSPVHDCIPVISPLSLKLQPAHLEDDFWAANVGLYSSTDRWSLILASLNLIIPANCASAVEDPGMRRLLLTWIVLVAVQTAVCRAWLSWHPDSYNSSREWHVGAQRVLRSAYTLVSCLEHATRA